MIKQLRTKERTVWNRWHANAERNPSRDAIVHWVAGEEPFRWTFSSLMTAAEEMSEVLMEADIRKGDVCAIILRHNRLLYPLYLATICIGAIPAFLAYPNPRLHPDKFRQGIRGMSERSGLDWILSERCLEEVLRPCIESEHSTIKGLHFPLEWGAGADFASGIASRPVDIQKEITSMDPVLLQHSSGTTGLQKPVVLSHCAVLDHVKNYGDSIELNESDKIVSWLPLYHDMGLIAAFHLPLAFGIPSVQMDPFEWVTVPSLLLEAISKERGTICWLPNFAYNMMADKIRDDELDSVDLQSLRLVINCSEPIRHESHQKFVNRFRRYGLNPLAVSSCYAMAETTFAVTQTVPGTQPTVRTLDRCKLANGYAEMARNGAPARVCVSSGKAIAGCQVRIVDKDRQPVGENIVGEIAIRSVSMFGGYRNYPEKTAEVLDDGWYYSGDYGFYDTGEYYVIGRKKDIIIVAGNNIYPEDIEDAIGNVKDVIPGRVVAFGEMNEQIGSEQVSIIAESKVSDKEGCQKLKIEIIRAGMAIDITIAAVYLVPPRWLIKSSAGKPSRQANKERILSELRRSTGDRATDDNTGIKTDHTSYAQVS